MRSTKTKSRAGATRKRGAQRAKAENQAARKPGIAGVVFGLILASGVGYGAYFLGESFSSRVYPEGEVIVSVDQAVFDEVAALGRAKEKAKVKSAAGSVFSEGEAPTVVGAVPDGWRVETSPDVKAKFGPHPVPGSEDITFVVPVYTLVPDEHRNGAYVMEPGRTEDGQDMGGTLGSVLRRMEMEAGNIAIALGALTDSLKGLEPYAEGDEVLGEEVPQ